MTQLDHILCPDLFRGVSGTRQGSGRTGARTAMGSPALPIRTAQLGPASSTSLSAVRHLILEDMGLTPTAEN